MSASVAGTSCRSAATGSRRGPSERPRAVRNGGARNLTHRFANASAVKARGSRSKHVPRTRMWKARSRSALASGVAKTRASGRPPGNPRAAAATWPAAVPPSQTRSSTASPAASWRSQRAVARRLGLPACAAGHLTIRLLGSEDHTAMGRSMSKARDTGWPLAARTMELGHSVQEAETPKVPSACLKKEWMHVSKSCWKKYLHASKEKALSNSLPTSNSTSTSRAAGLKELANDAVTDCAR